jgi:nucleotide-binding universal stress UspA family protein
MTATEGVLVGYDGSRCSELALSWAAREARARVVRLTVCRAFGPGGMPPADEAGRALARRDGAEVLARGVRLAQAAMATGPVAPLLVDGPAAAALCGRCSLMTMVVLGARGTGALLSAARDAQLVVVGRHGLGGSHGMRLGSVGQVVLSHAPCPVAIISH